jgi:hypothetical protein
VVSSSKRPLGVAERLSLRRKTGGPVSEAFRKEAGQWNRETFTLPRIDAREKARSLFARFPKAAYMTEIEWWRECDDGQIEFTIRRLRSAD